MNSVQNRNSIVNNLVLVYILFAVFESPLRLIFSFMKLAQLIYIKDFILLLCVFIGLYLVIQRKEISIKLLSLIFVGVLSGLFNGLNIYQVLFGIKMFLPLIAGFFASYYFGILNHWNSRTSYFLILIILFGLFLDLKLSLPWAGLSYSIGDFNVEGNREWTTFGVERLAGFQRSSFDSAILLYSLYLLYMTSNLLKGNKIFNLSSVLLLLLTFYGVYLTTSKVSYLSIIILCITLLLLDIHQRTEYLLNKLIISIVLKIIGLSVFLLAFLPPFFAMYNPATAVKLMSFKNEVLSQFFSSFLDRVLNTWPNAFNLIENLVQLLIGKGIGSIGAAQSKFDIVYNPGDNVFVYLFITFGMLFVIILILFLLKLITLQFKSNKESTFILMFISVCTYGATLNFIESSILSLILGVFLGYSKFSKSVRSSKLDD